MKDHILIKEGIPTLIIATIFTLILYIISPLFSIIGIGIIIFILYFFRDPKRIINKQDFVVISPADGVITNIEEVYEEKYFKDRVIRISIFMSPLDVHINRSPILGEVNYIEYVKGKFTPATKFESHLVNEKNYIGIENSNIKVLVVQIAGAMARRIVNWTEMDQELQMGDKIGMIKFSSGTQIFLPLGTDILVNEGEKVVSGLTLIGRYQ